MGSQDPVDVNEDVERIKKDMLDFENGAGVQQRSVLSCPDCGGVLWEVAEDDLVQYRCHIGHAFSVETLQEKQNNLLEHAFWAALRALTEKAALAARLAARARERGMTHMENRYVDQVRETQRQMEPIRLVLGQPEDWISLEAGKQSLEVWDRQEQGKRRAEQTPPDHA